MSIETDAHHEGGLSEKDVVRLRSEGKSNDVPARASRSVRDIVRGNVFTRINAILGVLLVIVLATGSVIDGMFGLLIIANSDGLGNVLTDQIVAQEIVRSLVATIGLVAAVPVTTALAALVACGRW